MALPLRLSTRFTRLPLRKDVAQITTHAIPCPPHLHVNGKATAHTGRFPTYTTMSTAQYTYVLNAPYQTSQDAMNRRSAHRPTHLDRINRMYAEGTLVFAGPTLSEDSNPAAPSTEWKPQGSLMIFRAESLEKVKEIVRDDLFWTEDVWDKEKIRINPIIPATPPL